MVDDISNAISDNPYEKTGGGEDEIKMYEELQEIHDQLQRDDEENANTYLDELQEQDLDAYQRLVSQQSVTNCSSKCILTPVPDTLSRSNIRGCSSTPICSMEASPPLKKTRLGNASVENTQFDGSIGKNLDIEVVTPSSSLQVESNGTKIQQTERLLPRGPKIPTDNIIDLSKVDTQGMKTSLSQELSCGKMSGMSIDSVCSRKRLAFDLDGIDVQFPSGMLSSDDDVEDDLFADDGSHKYRGNRGSTGNVANIKV